MSLRPNNDKNRSECSKLIERVVVFGSDGEFGESDSSSGKGQGGHWIQLHSQHAENEKLEESEQR